MNTLSRLTLNSCLLVACALGAVACAAEEAAFLEMTVTEVGPDGGVARSSDGLLSLQFSPGALAAGTNITVTVLRDHGRGEVVSPVYELGPDGLEFDAPVVLTIEAPGVTTPLDVANLDDPIPAVLADSTQSGSSATGTLAHFSSYGLVVGTEDADTLAGVTGGSTSVLLDIEALSAAGLDVSGVTEEVIVPGDLGPDSVAFPINPRTGMRMGNVGNAPTTFVYDFVDFAPVRGTIEHNGWLYFDQQFASGNFTIGFDPARVSDVNSGFFVESTVEGFLLIAGVFFDIATPSFVDARETSLTIEADLLVAPELAEFLRNPALVGADVGDALVSATAARTSGGPR